MRDLLGRLEAAVAAGAGQILGPEDTALEVAIAARKTLGITTKGGDDAK